MQDIYKCFQYKRKNNNYIVPNEFKIIRIYTKSYTVIEEKYTKGNKYFEKIDNNRINKGQRRFDLYEIQYKE